VREALARHRAETSAAVPDSPEEEAR